MKKAGAGTGVLLLVGLHLMGASGAPFLAAQEEQAQGNGGAGGDVGYVFARVEVQAGEAIAVPLTGDHAVMVLTDDGQARSVPVELVVMRCAYEVEYTLQGKAYHHSAESQLLYELRSRQVDIPYTWAFFSARVPVEPHSFCLAAPAAGENHLAWADARGVTSVRMLRPRDRYSALREMWVPDPTVAEWYQVSVPRIVLHESDDPGEWFGTYATWYDITLLSFAEDEDGTWVMKVHGTNPEPVFTLTSTDRETWHLQQQPQEPAAP